MSKVVQQAIAAPQPKARYLAGFPLSGRLVLLLGASIWERVVCHMFKISGR